MKQNATQNSTRRPKNLPCRNLKTKVQPLDVCRRKNKAQRLDKLTNKMRQTQIKPVQCPVKMLKSGSNKMKLINVLQGFLVDFSFVSRNFGQNSLCWLKSFFAKINLNTVPFFFLTTRKTVLKKAPSKPRGSFLVQNYQMCISISNNSLYAIASNRKHYQNFGSFPTQPSPFGSYIGLVPKSLCTILWTALYILAGVSLFILYFAFISVVK